MSNIICYIGTRAQLIKMAPVLVEFERRNVPIHLIFTGQHSETMREILADFNVKFPIDSIYEGKEITGILQMAKWFVYCLRQCISNPQRFAPKSANGKDILLVHGDTFSTLLGAVVGRLRKIPVAHIESGLRSFHWFHPFPEELTRLLTFKLSSIAFCPGPWAYNNLRSYKLERIDTVQNTLLDSLYLALNNKREKILTLETNYVVCSIHRFENIFFRNRLEGIIHLLEIVAKTYQVVFVLHPATRKKLTEYGLLARLEENPAFTLSPRMSYIDFVALIHGAAFVITDGGSNQEELSYMQIPTLLMRKATERQEGMDSTVTLCQYDESILNMFLKQVKNTPRQELIPDHSPSQQIVENILARLELNGND